MSALSFLPSFLSRSLLIFFVCWTQAHSLKVFQMISNITVKLSRRWSSSIRVRSATHFSSCFSCRIVRRRGENFSRCYSVQFQGKWGNDGCYSNIGSESHMYAMIQIFFQTMILFYIGDNQFPTFSKMDDLSVIEFQTNNGLVKLNGIGNIDMYIHSRVLY